MVKSLFVIIVETSLDTLKMINEGTREYKSVAYYQSITGLEFKPLEIKEAKPKYLKGQVISKIRFFGHTFCEKIAEEDLYYFYGELYNKGKYASAYGLKINENGDLIYRAVVNIYISGKCTSHYFMTNEEAIGFINEIKKKCSECGNKLL